MKGLVAFLYLGINLVSLAANEKGPCQYYAEISSYTEDTTATDSLNMKLFHMGKDIVFKKSEADIIIDGKVYSRREAGERHNLKERFLVEAFFSAKMNSDLILTQETGEIFTRWCYPHHPNLSRATRCSSERHNAKNKLRLEVFEKLLDNISELNDRLDCSP